MKRSFASNIDDATQTEHGKLRTEKFSTKAADRTTVVMKSCQKTGQPNFFTLVSKEVLFEEKRRKLKVSAANIETVYKHPEKNMSLSRKTWVKNRRG